MLTLPGNTMSRLRVESFTLSLDGFGAGPDQDLENPLGVGGTALHGWAWPTRTFQQHLFGNETGATGIDEDFAARGFAAGLSAHGIGTARALQVNETAGAHAALAMALNGLVTALLAPLLLSLLM